MRPQYEQATPRKPGDPPAHQFPEPSLYPVANHRRANRTANNKAYLRPRIGWYAPAGSSRVPATTAPPARRPERSVRRNSSGLLIRVCCGSTTPPAQPRLPATAEDPSVAESDGELLAALATARGEHGAAGPGTHPQAEAVDLRPPTVVRLERALAHWSSRYGSETDTGQARSCRVPRGRTQVDTPASDRRSRDMAQPVNGKGDPGLGQTNRGRPASGQPVPQSTTWDTSDFHSASAAGHVACGKSTSAGRSGRASCRRGTGETAVQRRTHLVDGPVDNELRSTIEVIALGQCGTRGEHIGERSGSGGGMGTIP